MNDDPKSAAPNASLEPQARAETDWFCDHGELLAFARALADSGEIGGVMGLLALFEKPWKWSPEYDRWRAAGRPVEMSKCSP